MTRVLGKCKNITDLIEALEKSKFLWKNLIFMKL